LEDHENSSCSWDSTHLLRFRESLGNRLSRKLFGRMLTIQYFLHDVLGSIGALRSYGHFSWFNAAWSVALFELNESMPHLRKRVPSTLVKLEWPFRINIWPLPRNPQKVPDDQNQLNRGPNDRQSFLTDFRPGTCDLSPMVTSNMHPTNLLWFPHFSIGTFPNLRIPVWDHQTRITVRLPDTFRCWCWYSKDLVDFSISSRTRISVIHNNFLLCDREPLNLFVFDQCWNLYSRSAKSNSVFSMILAPYLDGLSDIRLPVWLSLLLSTIKQSASVAPRPDSRHFCGAISPLSDSNFAKPRKNWYGSLVCIRLRRSVETASVCDFAHP
jgi:hypothetical protein